MKNKLADYAAVATQATALKKEIKSKLPLQ